MIQREIQESAFRAQRAIEAGDPPVVGMTRFQTTEDTTIPTFRVDAEMESIQQERVKAVRTARDASAWRASIDAVEHAARGSSNLVPAIIDAVRAKATVGEISDTLREVFGEHREARTV